MFLDIAILGKKIDNSKLFSNKEINLIEESLEGRSAFEFKWGAYNHTIVTHLKAYSACG